MNVNRDIRSNLDNLPDDVLGIIFRQLDLNELIGLRRVGRGMYDRVTSLGIPLYLSSHRQSQITLFPSSDQWDPLNLLKHNHYIKRSLAHHRFHALQVGPTWSKSVIPTLEITFNNLVIGVGSKISVHPLRPTSTSDRHGGKVIDRAVEYDIRTKKDQGGKSDIIGIVPIDGGSSGEYIVAQFDGTIQRIHLPFSSSSSSSDIDIYGYTNPTLSIKARYSSFTQPKESINTLTGTADGRQFVTTSVSGRVNIYSTNSPWTEPSFIQLKSPRAWSSLLSNSHDNSIGPMAILGIQGGMDIYNLLPTGISSRPNRKLIGPEEPLLSSPYCLQLPPTNPDGTPQTSHNPNLLLSGWYDSHLRIHDLRLPFKLPVGQFSDQYTWSDGSAYYSTCWVGEYHIAGGTSKHGTISFFDIRNSKNKNKNKNDRTGWSCFSPNGKGSPVYSMKYDNGKIYGVTERRSFVLSFDHSGEYRNGILSEDLRKSMILQSNRDRDKGRYAPNGYKARGGKWTWSMRNEQDDKNGGIAVGYEHTSKGGVELFDSLVSA
ncbi:hypothetical protein I203_107914 [Kwoniella mangroviensis CBS 8507]|uniref:hypothetical protein n=1 Tax=Kwoniella mangroviensis CBS 8507 TaxID=1296122 RepID=UPI00306D6117